MLKLLLFSVFCSHVLSIDQDFLKIIESNIDESINPCDNFYRHSCSLDKPDTQTIKEFILDWFRKDLETVTYPHEFRFLKNISIEDSDLSFIGFLRDLNQTNEISRIADDYYQSCSRNITSAEFILSQLYFAFNSTVTDRDPVFNFINLKFDPNCTRASENLREQLQIVWKDNLEENKVDEELINSKLDNIRAYFWYMKNGRIFSQMNEFITDFKKELRTQIEKTSWIENSNSLKGFLNAVDKIHLVDPLETFNDVDEFRRWNKTMDDCKWAYEIESLKILCFVSLKLEKPYVKHNVMNAFNIHPIVTATIPIFYLFTRDLPPSFIYGSIGLTMAHEIGHSVIKSLHDEPLLPYFPDAIKQCVQNQFVKACKFFKEGDCETVDEQFDENGSDIFGVQMAYNQFKKLHGENLDKFVEGSKYKITNEQLFFYGFNYIACKREKTVSNKNDPHHARVARVNSAFAQIPEFENVFKCNQDDMMMQSKEKQCFIFGENAE